MYDELVKRLREPCQYENCILCQQAADAIESLTCEIKSLRDILGAHPDPKGDPGVIGKTRAS